MAYIIKNASTFAEATGIIRTGLEDSGSMGSISFSLIGVPGLLWTRLQKRKAKK